MSVELRVKVYHAPNCNCGKLTLPGVKPTCSHQLVCQWGEFDNPEANPAAGLQPLMITTWSYVGKLLADGPRKGPNGGVHSITTTMDDTIGEESELRVFAHLDYQGMRTTWELHDAHFIDGVGPDDLVIGRWPD